MLKIEPDGAADGSRILRIEGQVIGPWVEELRRVCERALAEAGDLTLDLAEVAFVDRNGVALLHGLAERKVTLANCSGFVAELLRAAAPR